MHHLRSVKDVRVKFRNASLTFDEWKGAFERKQIPLCQYHHQLLHSGNLNHADVLHLAKYRANIK
jgi:hypothetical protein